MTTRPSRETVDEQLARLRRETEGLAPRGDLAARVARGLDARRGLAAVVLPFGRAALVAAAFAAAASVALAIGAERLDDAAGAEIEALWWEP